MSLSAVVWCLMNMGRFRYTILLFLGSAKFAWELSRNLLQGVTDTDWIVMQKQEVYEEVMPHSQGSKSSNRSL